MLPATNPLIPTSTRTCCRPWRWYCPSWTPPVRPAPCPNTPTPTPPAVVEVEVKGINKGTPQIGLGPMAHRGLLFPPSNPPLNLAWIPKQTLPLPASLAQPPRCYTWMTQGGGWHRSCSASINSGGATTGAWREALCVCLRLTWGAGPTVPEVRAEARDPAAANDVQMPGMGPLHPHQFFPPPPTSSEVPLHRPPHASCRISCSCWQGCARSWGA